MNTLPSSDFRKTYAQLAEPTEVTVLGRTIGTWYPAGTAPDDGPRETRAYAAPPVDLRAPGFGHSTPVPKPGKKAK